MNEKDDKRPRSMRGEKEVKTPKGWREKKTGKHKNGRKFQWMRAYNRFMGYSVKDVIREANAKDMPPPART